MNATTEKQEPRIYRCSLCGWDSASDPGFSEQTFIGCCRRCRTLLPAETLGRRFAAFSDEELYEMYGRLDVLDSGFAASAPRERLTMEILAEQELRREQRLGQRRR